MILPKTFIEEISEDALDDFLDHLILTNSGNESYQGDLENDRKRLLQALKRGDLLIDHSEEHESFGLISKEEAKSRGFE